jgi:hypothetical protein
LFLQEQIKDIIITVIMFFSFVGIHSGVEPEVTANQVTQARSTNE